MGTGYRYTIKTLWGLAKSKELGLTEEEAEDCILKGFLT